MYNQVNLGKNSLVYKTTQAVIYSHIALSRLSIQYATVLGNGHVASCVFFWGGFSHNVHGLHKTQLNIDALISTKDKRVIHISAPTCLPGHIAELVVVLFSTGCSLLVEKVENFRSDW